MEKELAETRKGIKEEIGKISSETQEGIEQKGEELNKEIKEGQERMEVKIRNMKAELEECVETRCERQRGLLMEQGERIRSLEADHGHVGPVSQGEVGGLHDAGCACRVWGGGG